MIFFVAFPAYWLVMEGKMTGQQFAWLVGVASVAQAVIAWVSK